MDNSDIPEELTKEDSLIRDYTRRAWIIARQPETLSDTDAQDFPSLFREIIQKYKGE